MIIAIDGPAASGKSSTAKAVAEEVGFMYLDTGAMYRAVTLAILEENISLTNENALEAFLTSMKLNILYTGKLLIIELDQGDVTKHIRDSKVTAKVSEVSALPVVRRTMVKYQRELVSGKDYIVEGRDRGTVVFPNADLKFYMIADSSIRAERRKKDLLTLGKNKDISKHISKS